MVKNYKTATILDSLQVGLTVRCPDHEAPIAPITIRLGADEAVELAHDLIMRAREIKDHTQKHVHFVR